MSEVYEIFPLKSDVSANEWQTFLDNLSFLHKIFDSYEIRATFKNRLVRYFLVSPRDLPCSLCGSKNFLLKKSADKKLRAEILPTSKSSRSKSSRSKSPRVVILNERRSTLPKLTSYLVLHKNFHSTQLSLRFKKLSYKNSSVSAVLLDEKNESLKLLFAIPAALLSIDFRATTDFLYSTPPKFLDLSKALPFLSSENASNTAFLKVDTFPYLSGEHYLNPTNLDLEKHMIVFGSSGSGKSKFLSLLTENFLRHKTYKVIILDPHASLENDLGGLGKVIDFSDPESHVDLFKNPGADPIISAELLLDAFKNLLNSDNPKLERVLHHSLFLLLTLDNFSLKTLRELLLDVEFRNDLVSKNQKKLPSSLSAFFLTEFSEIKTESFSEAIAPIITLIDELELLPLFRQQHISKNLQTTISENQLTIFSLNRAHLGTRAVNTISSLLMCQLFSLIQDHGVEDRLVFIIDEVAVIENPILMRFLSESRKFNLTLVLAGQYFSAISPELQSAIFANVPNYCIFRVSKNDASLLVNNLHFKLPLNDAESEKVKLLTGLKDRECLLRLSAGGKLIPAFKCITLDFKSHPRRPRKSLTASQFNNLAPLKIGPSKPFSFAKSKKFSQSTSANLHEILTLTSTRRHSARELLNRK